jgi:Kef-type K+ transport system membrane component KefB
MQVVASDSQTVLAALAPVIVLLFLGVVAAVGSRAIGVSPIVGYLLLGIGLGRTGLDLARDGTTIAMLAELGVVFLLFDIGLHFSLERLRIQARDIFGFGPVQVLFSTLLLGLAAASLGLSWTAAFVVGTTLSLSSTAVVAGLISERHQQGCPVGQTATAILIFQDVAAIFLVILVGSLGAPEGILSAGALALGRAAAAFGVAVVLARILVRPLFDVIARGKNKDVFTGMALLVALAAGWATGAVGLSLSLGAFLGGMIVAETPYRTVVQSEISPFRGLLLSFFFISAGFSIDVSTLVGSWPAILTVAAALLLFKIVGNAAASLAFRWSVPGSIQLSFLLAQGSEFAFFIFGIPEVRHLIGERQSSILVAAVAVSLALTPSLAEAGRSIAGSLRRKSAVKTNAELVPSSHVAPVLVVGMGRVGRDLAAAFIECGVEYLALERDEKRLREATADGYNVAFGDFSDAKIWTTLQMSTRRAVVLTAPSIEVSAQLAPAAQRLFPDLKRMAIVRDAAEAADFAALGMVVLIRQGDFAGNETTSVVLEEVGVSQDRIFHWLNVHRKTVKPAAVAA